jgi:phosphoglycolate phosphatase-like HAD superfamily hydrolase
MHVVEPLRLATAVSSVGTVTVKLTLGHTRNVKRLVLWDIDGTLVRGGDIGAHVFDLAIERVLGTRPPQRVRMSGKTDPQIVREYLAMLGLASEDHHIPAILSHLETELAAAKDLVRTHGCALPGVTEILPLLHTDPEFRQTVLTGNIAPNALVKLAAFSLERWLDLDIGAYGSDHADRNALVPIAIQRVADMRGVTYSPGEVWVVGDSPNDLACARAAGVRCLLVATGGSTFEQLRDLDPDVVRHDLAAVDDVTQLFRS